MDVQGYKNVLIVANECGIWKVFIYIATVKFHY